MDIQKKKVICVSSIKGGVGKTTTVANLAGAISKLYNKKVLVVDGNFSAPNLGIHFGYMNVPNTIQDVLDKRSKPHNAIYEFVPEVHVLPGMSSGKFSKRWSLKMTISNLKKLYDVIIIDTSPVPSELSKVLEVSDEIIFVATPDYPSLNTVLQLSDYVKNKIFVRGILLNMVKGKRFELKKSDIEEFCSLNVLGSVPYSVSVQKSVSKLSPLTFNSSWNRVFRSYKKILEEFFE